MPFSSPFASTGTRAIGISPALFVLLLLFLGSGQLGGGSGFLLGVGFLPKFSPRVGGRQLFRGAIYQYRWQLFKMKCMVTVSIHSILLM